jgi:hypothetical protein
MLSFLCRDTVILATFILKINKYNYRMLCVYFIGFTWFVAKPGHHFRPDHPCQDNAQAWTEVRERLP